ncbi:MAG: phospholipase [Acidobacteriota bacterium]
MASAQSIAVSTHGRYLVESPAAGQSRGLIVGFHGYAESAEIAFERLQAIPGATQWTVVSIQGLHRFYRGRSTNVVASWMTRQDRELAIDDNNAYVSAVVAAVARDSHAEMPLVFAGFSQGVAMAFRAACSSATPVSGVVAVGGDVPPELSNEQIARLPFVLLARGNADEYYAPAQWEADQARLRAAHVDLAALGFEGGHEWHADASRAAASLLERVGRAPGR